MPRLLELFSGTGSIGRAFEAEGWEVVSVDLDPKFRPTVLRRDAAGRTLAGQFRHGVGQPSVHGVLARPQPAAAGSGGGRPAGASRARDHRQPAAHGEPADGPSQDAGVHAGAALQRRVLLQIWIQATRIWHNLPWEPSQTMCRKWDRCDAFADGIHPEAAQRGTTNGRRNQQSQRQLYSMPPQLCDEIAAAASNP